MHCRKRGMLHLQACGSFTPLPFTVCYQHRHHSLSGGVAGSVSVFFLHPFDVLKTRLQGGCFSSKSGMHYKFSLRALQKMNRSTLAKDGIACMFLHCTRKLCRYVSTMFELLLL